MKQRMGMAVVAALLLLAAPTAAAKAAYSEQNDRLVLGNELITVSLQGKKPMLQVSDPQNASRGFHVFLQRLVEVPAGGATQGRDVVASFDLARAAAWQVNASQQAEGVDVTLHREGPVQVKAKGPDKGPVPLPDPVQNLTGNVTGNASANATVGNASVTIAFHLFDVPRQVRSGNETVNVTTHEVKFDLDVLRWPWVNPADVLALEVQVDGDAGAAGSAAAQGGTEVAAQQNGTRVGWVGWAGQAQAVLGGSAQNVTVEHRVVDDDGAKHWLVYQAPGFERLTHDPSVGLDPVAGTSATGMSRVPAPGALAVLGVAGIAAVALRRKR